MGVEFTLPLTAEGAVTAPSNVFPFVEPSAESETFLDVGPMNVLEIPEGGGSKQFMWLMSDGVNKMRLATRGSVYDVGGLAPGIAPVAAVVGAAQATVVGTWSGQPGDGETIVVGIPGTERTITFKNTLVISSTERYQVKIGANADETYTNLSKLILDTGTNMVEYFDYDVFRGFVSFWFAFRIEVSAFDTTANTITLRYIDYGTYGNTCTSTETAANFGFASTTFTGGLDGTGTAPEGGTKRYFYTWARDADGAETGRSPIITITTSGNYNIAVSAPAASADATFDYVNFYRTAKSGVEFYLVGSKPRADLTLTDDVSDEDLVVGDPWNDLLYRLYAEGMGPRGRALALWKGKAWTVGAHLSAEYSHGEVAVTNGSATISFVKAGTATALQGVSELMVSRTFKVADTSEEYTLLSVNETAATAVIDREYEGTTDAHVGFTIRDTYDACRIRASIAFKYNQWPVNNSPGRVDTDDAEGGTALLATEERLFIFTKTSITSLTGDNEESWVLNKLAQGVGCVGPRLVVAADTGGFFLSTDGFYGISGLGDILCISSPKSPKGTIAQGIDETVARIAWANADQGYSIYDREERLVIFGLPLDGATVPNYEFVFDLQNSTWALYKRAEWTSVVNATLPDGTLGILSGDREGNLWHVGIGESDGFYGAEAVQTLSGAQTVRVLTVAGTPFTSTGIGKPVIVLDVDGETVQYGKVASSTSSELTLCEDLDTAPAAGDQIVLGGIAWQAKSGFATFGEEYRQKKLRSVTIRHAPTTRGEYYLSFAVDGGSFALCPKGTSIGDLTDKDGKVRHKTMWPGDSHAINLRGFKPGGRVKIRGGVFDVIAREHGRI